MQIAGVAQPVEKPVEQNNKAVRSDLPEEDVVGQEQDNSYRGYLHPKQLAPALPLGQLNLVIKRLPLATQLDVALPGK